MAIGARIRHLRKSKKMTLDELSERISIGLSMLGHIERGKNNPTIPVLDEIAEALGVHPAALIDESIDVDNIEAASMTIEAMAKLDSNQIKLIAALVSQLEKAA